MKLLLRVFAVSARKGLLDRRFLEKGEAPVYGKPPFDDGYEPLYGEGNPDLGLHRILGGPIEGLDSQVLLDP